MAEEKGSWTLATLHHHLNRLLDERDAKYEIRFRGVEEAARAAATVGADAAARIERATEKRFESVNEFRQTLSEQAATLMPRAETETLNRVVTDKISALDTRLNATDARLTRLEGRGSGMAAGWGYLVAAIGAVAAIVGIVLALSR